VGLSAHERQSNVRGAFKAEARIVNGKKVLLMDDVATTGATLIAASQALVDAGARQVYALTVAKAISRYGSDAVLNTPFRPLR
jgi:predicted amidophosphoribosyltransferase